MTYEDIQRANEQIRTTDIKGKQYAEVNQRIKAFRVLCPGGRIKTEMLSNENGTCVFKATAFDANGNELGNGHAYEKESSSFINKTSYIENCETSAVGRALGMCGIGIDSSVASYEEVSNAMLNQKKTVCEDCGAEITKTIGKDGKYVPAERVIEESNKRTGKTLCAECLKKAGSK